MFDMILKMSLVTILYVVFTALVEMWVDKQELSRRAKISIGLIYGLLCVFSTHFGIDYQKMMLNVRDIGPLAAGLFFDPLSGIIAGFVGGIERYIAGTYFGIGSYTAIACSVSTCLAGVLAAVISKFILEGEKPQPIYSLFIGAIMEVFHMYAVILTHRDDVSMAFFVVDVCSVPMITFTALGLAGVSVILLMYSGEWKNPFIKRKAEEVSLSESIKNHFFGIMIILTAINLAGSYAIQTEIAYKASITALARSAEEIKAYYEMDGTVSDKIKVGDTGIYLLYDNSGKILSGYHVKETIPTSEIKFLSEQVGKDYFRRTYYGQEYLCRVKKLNDGNTLVVGMTTDEVFYYRNIQAYELGFGAVILFAVMYFMISIIIYQIVIKRIDQVNNSLSKITNGDLDEVVDVRSSSEFASLSNDINTTVDALKGYINDAKKRIEEEIELASNIQKAVLPTNFKFKNHQEFELWAAMHAAKGVGGDFYDFFFLDDNKLALVIADVSGKGIPGAMFMMRAKTTIRGQASSNTSVSEILYRANNTLCEGNAAEMFVTAWLGIIDLETGIMKCANFGHEYPILMRANGNYEVFKDEHSLPLATFEGIKAKEYEIVFKPGDRIFAYTDGVPEAINKQKEQYGIDRLVNFLNANKNDPFELLLDKEISDIKKFANGEEQFDDITMIAFKLNDYSKN